MSKIQPERQESKPRRPNPGPRYTIIPHEFFADMRLSAAHMRVMASIGRHTNELGWCRLKQRRIATETGLARQTVCIALNELIEWGHIQRHEMTKGQSLAYRVLLDYQRPLTDEDIENLPEVDLGWIDQGVTHSRQGLSPTADRGCQHVGDRGCHDSGDNKNDLLLTNSKSTKGKKDSIGFPSEEKKGAPKAPLSEAEFAAALARKKVAIELHPQESGWWDWMEKLPPMIKEKAAMAGRIIVSARFPWQEGATYSIPDANVQWQKPSAMPAKGGAA